MTCLFFVSVSSIFVLTGYSSVSSTATISPLPVFKRPCLVPLLRSSQPPASAKLHCCLKRVTHAQLCGRRRRNHQPRATATPPSPTPTVTSTQPPAASSPTPKGYPAPEIPSRLLIPVINLDVPIVAVGWSVVEKDGQQISEWDVPNWRAAGWLNTSARIGAPGNTVFEGHQDIDGRVFENLEYLKEGDAIQVQAASYTRTYVVALRTIVPEKDQPLNVRRENARWIGPSLRRAFDTCHMLAAQ